MMANICTMWFSTAGSSRLSIPLVDLIPLRPFDVAKSAEKVQQIAKGVSQIAVTGDVEAQLRDVLAQQVDGILGLLRRQNRACVQRKSVIK